jgi:peptide/nickel transport system ATP-binding protein
MNILEVKSMSIALPHKTLTEDVSFYVKKGEILSLVGESGSGKSITALACCGLLPEPHGFLKSGEVFFGGREISKLSEQEFGKIRGNDIAMIFQEPAAALNPLMKVKHQMLEYFNIHKPNIEKSEVDNTCLRMLDRVGLDSARVFNSYPHELSGGMQQRVMIAMALLLDPKLLIADEPTTALDVTVQAQIMDLLLDLQEEIGMSILFITHNLALVAQYCDRLVVMQDGRLLEENTVPNFLEKPQTEYGQHLLNSVPRL